MREMIKKVLHELGLHGYTSKQKALIGYFVISLCLLCGISEETGIVVTILLVVNFGISATFLRGIVPLDDDSEL